MDRKKGHWILAKMGKKVLRPGGKELTLRLLDQLKISPEDHVAEFAPGLGFTAAITLQKQPRSYIGIERNEEAADRLRDELNGINNVVTSNAADSTLESNSMDKVYGEAMLTMQADHRKSEIMREASRILRPEGLYGIHELGLTPSNISSELKAEIQRGLATTIKVNARPVTEEEWVSLLEGEGFDMLNIDRRPMHLLRKRRVIDDEGTFRAMKICFNVLTHPRERKRLQEMRSVFRKYEHHLNAITVTARKRLN